jgi:hypothetical protein
MYLKRNKLRAATRLASSFIYNSLNQVPSNEISLYTYS